MLKGTVHVPGDKSLAHRCLIFAAMAEGVSAFQNFPDSQAVRSTGECLKSLGVRVRRRGARLLVAGRGPRDLAQPQGALNAGNSATAARLLMGLLAGCPLRARMTGDPSLKRRPMERVAEPLRRMGARIELSAQGRLPMKIQGGDLRGIAYSSPVASAQVKSAVLIAGLFASGETSVTEPLLSRDHTERLLPIFGVPIKKEGLTVTVHGRRHLHAVDYTLPGDPSSAAVWAVAAALAPGSRLCLPRILANPTRTGYIQVLRRMGGSIKTSKAAGAPEPAFDIRASFALLKAAIVTADEIPGLIDELPLLALAASQAQGTSRFQGLGELRRKESDRLSGIVELLKSFGARAHAEGDDLVVEGPCRLKGARIQPRGDHRLAMTALVAGLLADGPTTVAGADCIAISYPGFGAQLKRMAET